MRMCDFLLPHNTAMCSLYSRFTLDDRMLGAAILHQVLSETWGYPSRNNLQNSGLTDDAMEGHSK
jgi:hypothetical protein